MKVITDILQRCFWCPATYMNPLWADLCKKKSLQNIAWHWQKPCSYCKWKITADHSTQGLGQILQEPLHWQAEASVKSATETDGRRQKVLQCTLLSPPLPIHTEHQPLTPIQVLLLFKCCLYLRGTRRCQLLQGTDGTGPFSPNTQTQSSISPRLYANCNMVSWQLQKEQSTDLM